MTQSKPTVQTQSNKEATPPRVKLPKNYKLPNAMKCAWFFSMGKAAQGDTRVKNASKRDIEQYAESAANRNVGRASVAV